MKSIKLILSISFLIASVSCIYSQKKNNFTDNIFWGGSLGLQLGTITQVDVSPFIGYNITERLKAGFGASYQYYSDLRPQNNFETDIYGGRIFSSMVVVDDLNKILPFNSIGTSLFIHAEVEILSLESEVWDYNHKYPGQNRFYLNSYLIGLGIKQRIGARSSVNLTILWNLNEITYSPYSNPVMRVGFSF